MKVDQLEHVGDLTWPLSIRTYARMRHDPVLASVLAAYSLPIIKTSWHLDPRGAPAKVAKLCADSLGLPPNFRVLPSRLPTINPRVRIPWEQLYAPLLLRLSDAA